MTPEKSEKTAYFLHCSSAANDDMQYRAGPSIFLPTLLPLTQVSENPPCNIAYANCAANPAFVWEALWDCFHHPISGSRMCDLTPNHENHSRTPG